jgi:NAD+ synthase (glutamine-hydrolysing)
MKIALAQIDTQIGNLEGNARKILSFSEKAKRLGAALVVFPELTLPGYPPKDLLDKPHFIEANERALRDLTPKVKGIQAIVGFAEGNSERQGRAVFNSAAWIQNGKVEYIQRKILLPTYDVFDESRHFEPGKDSKVLHLPERVGISICEDIWSEELFWGRRLYSFDPIQALSAQGMDFLVNLSASPYQLGKQEYRQALVSKTAQRHGVPILYVNLVGGNDDLIFDGNSLVADASGRICEKLKAFREDLLIVDTERLSPQEVVIEPDLEQLYQALVLGLGDYIKKSGFKKVVMGLSGGIDSSLVACLAAKACGKKNVLGVSLPSSFSTPGSLSEAKELAKNLGITYQVIPIKNLYRAYNSALGWKEKHVDISLQNIQARIRGNLLMALSNREVRLLLSTGNKSEMAVGYCTLYGDMAGGLAVISDLPKTTVYALARHINNKTGAIPEAVFKKAPSPELAPNQVTQDDLPPFEILDEVLKRYIEENQGLEEIVKAGYPRNLVKKIMLRVDRNEYKRKQAPPGLRVTGKAFGTGRRIPITNAFRE